MAGCGGISLNESAIDKQILGTEKGGGGGDPGGDTDTVSDDDSDGNTPTVIANPAETAALRMTIAMLQNEIETLQEQLAAAETQGPAGPEGPEGPAGPIGPEGPTGPAGPAGPKGDPGDDGDAGNDGSDGIAGPEGPDGPAGPPGDKGDDGDDGNDGNPGVAGPTGPQGPTGPAGPQGDPGDKGDPGDDGDAGPQGVPGNDGSDGMDIDPDTVTELQRQLDDLKALLDVVYPLACGDDCLPFLVRTDLSESVTVTRTLNPGGTQATLTATGGVEWVAGISSDSSAVRTSGDYVLFTRDLDALSEDDYLHYGYWRHTTNSNDRGGYAVGAPLPNDYRLPLRGMATYSGPSSFRLLQSNIALQAEVSFTAEFNGNGTTMSGTLDQDFYNFVFEEATFSGGKFSGGAVVCGNLGCIGTLTDNTWEGAFFGKADSAKGNAPTKFGGTFQMSGVELFGGSANAIIGGFGAELQ